MEDKKKIDKKKILQITPFVVMALFVVGLLSYATLAIDFGGLKISGVTKPEVSMSYEEKSNALDLELTPLSDDAGKAQTNYFEFSVDASGKIDGEIPANIYIKEIAKDIDNSNIKMYLTKVENGTETQVLAPTTVNSLPLYTADTASYLLNTKNYSFNSTANTTYSDTYRLRVWLKSDATLPEGSYTTKEESDGSITAETASVSYSFKVNVSTKTLVNSAQNVRVIIEDYDNEAVWDEFTVEATASESNTASKFNKFSNSLSYSNPTTINALEATNKNLTIVNDARTNNGYFIEGIETADNDSINKVFWYSAVMRNNGTEWAIVDKSVEVADGSWADFYMNKYSQEFVIKDNDVVYWVFCPYADLDSYLEAKLYELNNPV